MTANSFHLLMTMKTKVTKKASIADLFCYLITV